MEECVFLMSGPSFTSSILDLLFDRFLRNSKEEDEDGE